MILTKMWSHMYLGQETYWLGFCFKRSKVKVIAGEGITVECGPLNFIHFCIQNIQPDCESSTDITQKLAIFRENFFLKFWAGSWVLIAVWNVIIIIVVVRIRLEMSAMRTIQLQMWIVTTNLWVFHQTLSTSSTCSVRITFFICFKSVFNASASMPYITVHCIWTFYKFVIKFLSSVIIMIIRWKHQ